MADPFWSTLNQALASGSKSTALKPLGWLVGLTLTGAIAAYRFNSDAWFSDAIGALCVLSVILYFASFIYFALTDRDALRSEKYSIQKMAIQRGFIGDDQTGYIPLVNNSGVDTPALSHSASSKRGEEEK